MSKRVFLIVLDSVGIGGALDADAFGDEGSNTLGAICHHPSFSCPHLEHLGLFHIDGVGEKKESVVASYARMREASRGKDTTIGHWEIAGIISADPLPTYPNGFPASVIQAFEEKTGRRVLCNRPYSGTQVIRDYGEAHCRTGDLIVYTSADSVFQIAAHEDVVSVEELYRYCGIAREMLTGEHGVGRVIARPFTGSYPFVRTPRRHDFSLIPPQKTMPLCLQEHGLTTISVGKIFDIFAGIGFDESYPTTGNDHGMALTIEIAKRDFEGLCFVNLVDFDMLYGHRNDVAGYAAALSAFDAWLGSFLEQMRKDDILLITADHGCDPSTPSTDHSREDTPMLIVGEKIRRGVDLGVRDCFADIGATILDYFGVKDTAIAGKSFLSDCLRGEEMG